MIDIFVELKGMGVSKIERAIFLSNKIKDIAHVKKATGELYLKGCWVTGPPVVESDIEYRVELKKLTGCPDWIPGGNCPIDGDIGNILSSFCFVCDNLTIKFNKLACKLDGKGF